MQSKRERTRARILEAAWNLFREKGYQTTSTRQIARAAGIADGTVFSHFSTKLEILKAGIQTQIEQVIKQADVSLKGCTAEDRLLHYAEHLYPFYAAQAEFSRELFKEILWHQDELRPQIEAFIFKLFDAPVCAKDQVYGQVLMDCYFMTLLEGLGSEEVSARWMQERLTQKLAGFTSI
ncbi:TetR/AcrR family transcriptional regulator [Marinobacterium maritimum]|uniref:TetR/AcrR family transcriptional regulator n=1 Tax=Marinobacterium maritimum TaxID=500162 RepID=A0ABP3TEK8_9GAMM